MIISFDPSSTCTGWAVFDGGTYVDSGYIYAPAKYYEQNKEKIYYDPPPSWEQNIVEHVEEILDGREAIVCAVIEDVANWRMGAGARFAWAKSVGIVEGLCRRRGFEIHLVSAAWLAKAQFRGESKQAKELRRRVATALSGKKVTQVDEATAIILYDWWRGGTSQQYKLEKAKHRRSRTGVRRPGRKIGGNR